MVLDLLCLTVQVRKQKVSQKKCGKTNNEGGNGKTAKSERQTHPVSLLRPLLALLLQPDRSCYVCDQSWDTP